jgi:hypothetical protein
MLLPAKFDKKNLYRQAHHVLGLSFFQQKYLSSYQDGPADHQRLKWHEKKQTSEKGYV